MEERGQNKLTAKIIAFIGSSFSKPKFSSLLPLLLSPDTHPLRLTLYRITLSARASTFWRNRQADLLRRLQIDDELKLCRLLDRQVGRLGAFQYFIYISSGPAVQIEQAHDVTQKSTVFHNFTPVIYRRQPVFYHEVCNLCSLKNEDGAPQHEDCFSAPLGCGSECSLKILGISYV